MKSLWKRKKTLKSRKNHEIHERKEKYENCLQIKNFLVFFELSLINFHFSIHDAKSDCKADKGRKKCG